MGEGDSVSGPSTREEPVKLSRGRGGGQGHGGEMEETYLAFLNNTDACLLGGTLNLAFPALPAVTWRQSL